MRRAFLVFDIPMMKHLSRFEFSDIRLIAMCLRETSYNNYTMRKGDVCTKAAYRAGMNRNHRKSNWLPGRNTNVTVCGPATGSSANVCSA